MCEVKIKNNYGGFRGGFRRQKFAVIVSSVCKRFVVVASEC